MSSIHRLAVAVALCLAVPFSAAAELPEASQGSSPADEARVKIAAVRVTGVAEHPAAGITADSIQRVADAALREQAGADAAPAALTFAQLEQVAARVTQAYRLAGFVVATAILPPQQIGPDQVLTIQVVEGRIGQIRVQGSDRYHASALAAPMQGLAGQPLQSQTLQQALLYARELPGVSVSSVLVPGANPGETDVVIVAEDSARPYVVRLGGSNHGTDTTGRYRLETGVTLYSPLGVGDLLSASYAYALNPNDSWVGAVSYSLPFAGTTGMSGILGFTRSEIELGSGPFAALDINGPTTLGYAGVDWKFINRADLQMQASGRYIHEASQLDGLGFRLSEHTFDVLEAGLAVRQDQPSSRGINFAQVSVRKAFNDESAPENLIYAAHDSHFLISRLSLSRLQGITPTQRVLLRGNGQFTGDALPPLEQFSIGGPTSVRAVPLSAALGDRGVQATFEYQVDAPGFGAHPSPFQGRNWSDVLTLHAFYDWGRVSPVEQNRLIGVLPITYEGAGLGLVLRLPYQQGLQFNLSAATPTGNTTSPDGDDIQIWAGLGFTF
ncbi:MAG: ShlB/FhaC/HecB family hemolysin secretion/activation protein [Luteimonas sp.]